MWRYVEAVDYFRMFMELLVAFMVLYYLLKMLLEVFLFIMFINDNIFQVIYAARRRILLRYIGDVWNILDFANLWYTPLVTLHHHSHHHNTHFFCRYGWWCLCCRWCILGAVHAGNTTQGAQATSISKNWQQTTLKSSTWTLSVSNIDGDGGDGDRHDDVMWWSG